MGAPFCCRTWLGHGTYPLAILDYSARTVFPSVDCSLWGSDSSGEPKLIH